MMAIRMMNSHATTPSKLKLHINEHDSFDLHPERDDFLTQLNGSVARPRRSVSSSKKQRSKSARDFTNHKSLIDLKLAPLSLRHANFYDTQIYVDYLREKINKQNGHHKKSDEDETQNESKKRRSGFNTTRKYAVRATAQPLDAKSSTFFDPMFEMAISAKHNQQSAGYYPPFEGHKLINKHPSFKSKSFTIDPKKPNGNSSRPTARNDGVNSNKPFINTELAKSKTIIDLNQIAKNSQLSSHYRNRRIVPVPLDAIVERASRVRLTDLNLYADWPKSNMYKTSIRSNPWIKAYKEKSLANELNMHFRLVDTVYRVSTPPPVSVTHTHNHDSTVAPGFLTRAKTNLCLLPSIKQT